jgi:glycosyltransferase involved in cell wall biosynthesis
VDAIVLTFDVQLGLAELTHKRYLARWPNCPFTFRIPVNGAEPGPALGYLQAQPNCVLVPSPSPIGPSMQALLEGIDDDAWVYWCIDDRYPIWLDPDALDEICAGLDSCPPRVEEVKLLRWKERVSPRSVSVGSLPFTVQQPGTREWGFWHHHFIRAGTLRRVFGRPGLVGDYPIRDVLRPVIVDNKRASRARTGAEREIFSGEAIVPTRPLLRLGEPLKGRVLTANGLTELRRNHCQIPPYRSDVRHKVFAWWPVDGRVDERRRLGPPEPAADEDASSSPLDVLVLCGGLGAGGTERVVTTLAGGLTERGYRVEVASFSDAEADFYAVSPGVRRTRLHELPPAPAASGTRRTMRRRLTRLAGRLPRLVRARLAAPVGRVLVLDVRRRTRVRWVRQIIESRRPATVVSLGPGPNVATIVAARGLPCRVVVSERNDPERKVPDFPLACLCRWLYPKADVVTANSLGALETLGTWVPAARLAYLPNPVAVPEAARTGPPPAGFAGPCVLNVARLVPQKDQQVLLDAFAYLPPELDHWRLAIVGSGDQEKRLRTRAERLGIDGRVDWYGRTHDPYAFYRHADIFALPSRHEGMPNALLEAMRFGLPPIVADETPGPLEVVRHGETGLVVRTGDPDSVAAAITMLATRADLRRSLGAAAREEVARFEMDHALATWVDVLDLDVRQPRSADEPVR